MATTPMPMPPMLAPLEEELPIPDPNELAPSPGGDPVPLIPAAPNDEPAADRSDADPFVVPSIPTAADDPFDSDRDFQAPESPANRGTPEATPITWMPLPKKPPKTEAVIEAGWEEPLGPVTCPPAAARVEE
jgi:hypothetical protein